MRNWKDLIRIDHFLILFLNNSSSSHDQSSFIGANGFLGRHLQQYLSHEGFELKTLSRSGTDIDFKIDIGYLEHWDAIDYSPEVVINCAAILPPGGIADKAHAEKLVHTNFWGTYNLCTWLEKKDSVKYILNISSLSVVNKPWPVPLTEEASTYPLGQHALYSLSKLNQEIILSSYPFSRQVKIAHARLSALFGENMSWSGILCSLIDKALNKETISLTNGSKVSADFLYVKDACRHLISLVKNEAEGIINVASGRETYLKDLAIDILNLTAKDVSRFSNADNTEDYNRAVVDIRKLISQVPDFYNTEFNTALSNTIEFRKRNKILI